MALARVLRLCKGEYVARGEMEDESDVYAVFEVEKVFKKDFVSNCERELSGELEATTVVTALIDRDPADETETALVGDIGDDALFSEVEDAVKLP